jgi:hypothetical protein
MAKVYASCVVPASIEKVWEFLRDFNGLPKWFPGVTDSRIEGGLPPDQVGCIRNFGLEGGPRMREQLLALSDVNHSLTYKMLEGPLPITNYVPTFRLLPVTDENYTFAEGAVRFDCAKEKESELNAFFAQTYRGALDRLKSHFAGAKATP